MPAVSVPEPELSMPPDISTPQDTSMSRTEIRASASLASIFALRMLGLFLILPVFAVHAQGLPGGDSAFMVGMAMGIYGLVQAFGQLPFGMASDRFGRKPAIITGLIIFAAGSFIAAAADDLLWILVGRAVQGAGAISAAILALLADATREQHRTKAMAMVGGSIGITFAVSLILAPVLYRWIGMSGIFSFTGVLSILAIMAVIFVVPDAPALIAKRVPLGEVLQNRELMRLNYGVFVLHLMQLAIFVVVPPALVQALDLPVAEHWKVYLPVVLGSFVLMLPPIIAGEKGGKMKQVFILAIGMLVVVQAGLWIFLTHPGLHWSMLVLLLFVFFVAFNILEASQPSLVSRIAPPAAKGSALGVYNTLQSIGLACGGALGGWLKQHHGAGSVFILGIVLTLTWLIIAFGMRNLPRRNQAQPTAA